MYLTIVMHSYTVYKLDISPQEISQDLSFCLCFTSLPHVRERPFNLKGGGGVMVFCFVQNLFFGQHKSYLFCRAKREFFFQNLTLGYMTKTLNQIIFFFLHQNQNIFFSNIGNQNIFLEKNHNPSS